MNLFSNFTTLLEDHKIDKIIIILSGINIQIEFTVTGINFY